MSLLFILILPALLLYLPYRIYLILLRRVREGRLGIPKLVILLAAMLAEAAATVAALLTSIYGFMNFAAPDDQGSCLTGVVIFIGVGAMITLVVMPVQYLFASDQSGPRDGLLLDRY
ncbi:MAG: hypothetical protein WA952_00115 [Lewinella sp.]